MEAEAEGRLHRADELRLLAAAVHDMRVAEIEAVLGVEGGGDLPGGVFLELVGADELRVDADRAPRPLRGAVGSVAMGFEEGVDRRVTVAMDEERGTAVIDLLHRVVEHALRERQLPPPGLLPGRPLRQIRGGEGGRPSLRRTVGDDLHPADAETIAVVGFVGRWLAREDRVDLGEERE